MITKKVITKKDLTEKEIDTCIRNLCVRKLRVRKDIKKICIEKFPNEYDESDDLFFNKYAGKEVYLYPYNRNDKDMDLFILEDDNYELDIDCFEEIK